MARDTDDLAAARQIREAQAQYDAQAPEDDEPLSAAERFQRQRDALRWAAAEAGVE